MRRTHPCSCVPGETHFPKWPKSAPHHVTARDGSGVGSVSRFERARWYGVIFIEVPTKFGASLSTRAVPGWFKSRKTAVAAVIRAANAKAGAR